MTLAAKQTEITAALARCRNASERLVWLVDRAPQHPLLESALRVESNQMPGCLSRLWFVGEYREDRCWFRCASDSVIVGAVAGLLCECFSGHPPEEILNSDTEWLARSRLDRMLTSHRRNALARITERIREFAALHAH